MAHHIGNPCKHCALQILAGLLFWPFVSLIVPCSTTVLPGELHSPAQSYHVLRVLELHRSTGLEKGLFCLHCFLSGRSAATFPGCSRTVEKKGFSRRQVQKYLISATRTILVTSRRSLNDAVRDLSVNKLAIAFFMPSQKRLWVGHAEPQARATKPLEAGSNSRILFPFNYIVDEIRHVSARYTERAILP